MLFLIYTFHPLPPEASWKGQETDDVLSVGTLLRADLQSGRKTAEDHMKALFNLDLLFSFVCFSVHTHASAHECRKVQVSLSVVPQELSTSFMGGGEGRIPHRDLGLPFGVGWLASELWAPPPSPKRWEMHTLIRSFLLQCYGSKPGLGTCAASALLTEPLPVSGVESFSHLEGAGQLGFGSLLFKKNPR